MPFKLLDVDMATDFDEVIDCQWVSYENPYQSFFRLFCPLFGDGPSSHEESLKASTTTQLGWHTSDPASHWKKVVDDSGNIVGACLWKLYTNSPFANSEDDHSEAYWYPEGETREYVNECLRQFDASRRRMATRPQVCKCKRLTESLSGTLTTGHKVLNILFTHPDHRRQGVADLILGWGKQKADEMGVEMWLDATEHGVPVYLKHGFTVVHENRLRPTKASPGEAWEKMDRELQPMTFWQMWRPAGGDYVEGESVKPWE